MREPSERFVQVFDSDMIGQVKFVDTAKHKVKVAFKVPDEESYTGERLIISPWLSVLCTTPMIPNYAAPQTESAGDPVHTHDLNVHGWFPQINDIVVVRFLSAQNGDGFVYGGLTWH